MTAKSNKFSPPPIIAIVGQTATGKTSLSIEVAKKFSCEIISCDSRQVYKKLDIGSAKITKKEMCGVPHFGIDICDPKDETYSVSQFKDYGERSIKEIRSRGNVPLLVGGSGQYSGALLREVAFPKVPPNAFLRERLEHKTPEELASILQKKDIRRYETIDLQNKRRLIRALEIIEELGKVPVQKPQRLKNPKTLIIGLTRTDENLRARIHLRAKMRIDSSELQKEVRSLLEVEKISPEKLRSFGLEYRLTTDFLLGDISSKEELIDLLATKTWQFAKRQMTYYKKDMDIIWIPAEEKQKALIIIQDFLRS